jgi:sterol desaturase/sphingolipid hydroxylase (fatty acid hydroxylase superfamily)
METSDYYALLIPLFVALMAGEWLLLRRRGIRAYGFPDTFSNLGAGLGQLLFGIASGPLILALYDGFQERFSLLRHAPGARAPWVLAFVGVDLCYYAFHRSGHAVRLFFRIHGVHHQSERMNLSVALRQTWFSDLHALLFYWPLPLLGVAKEPFFVAVAFLSVYQVTLHTRLFPRASAWGLVFNTPSHHRVHHARAGAGGGRNFGATLIVWDRLFGTFQAEAGDLAFGVDPPLATWNPVKAQVALMGPARRPATPVPPGRSDAYAMVQAAGLFVGIALLVRASHRLPLGLVAPGALVSVVEMAALGALVDGDPRGERARLALLGVGGVVLCAFGLAPAGVALLALAVGSAIAFGRSGSALTARRARGRSTPHP